MRKVVFLSRGILPTPYRLERAGLVDVRPTPLQVLVGGVDMLRFFIVPASEDYYAQRGIGFALHQVLRFLDDPASLTDPIGFFTTTEGVIGHLMQVVHANPVYDVQLLAAREGGLDDLERQLEQMIAGTHPRARSIGAIVEEPDYHERLLAWVRAWRRDPGISPMLRSNVAASTDLGAIEHTFGSLPSAMRYFAKLPKTPFGAAWHLATVREFPADLGER